jgi:hypothetical protein
VPLKDANGCVMPLPSEPITMTVVDEFGNSVEIPLETVPMMVEEYKDCLYKCTVVPGYEEYVIEVEIGRSRPRWRWRSPTPSMSSATAWST